MRNRWMMATGSRRHWPPGMLDLAADVDDLGSVELSGRGFLESAKDANDPVMHGFLLSGDPDDTLTTGGGILFNSLTVNDLSQFA